MGDNNAGLILGIFAFYIVLFTVIGLISNSVEASPQQNAVDNAVGSQQSGITSFPTLKEDPNWLDYLGFLVKSIIPIFAMLLGFLALLITGMSVSVAQFPVWANAMIFTPLGITIIYIGVSLVRGSS